MSPLVLALPPFFWVAEATRRASFTTLGRDQGIFQYVAWALSRGDIDYRDVRDVNGPLTHLVHLVFLKLGGADEHRFRILDLVLSGAVFALAGACMPGIRDRSRPDALERVAWGAAGWVVLSAQYLSYGFWDLAQRESFFDWFLLSSVALQLVAQARSNPVGGPARASSASKGSFGAIGLLVAVGALSVVPCFGKPTYGLFTLLQLGTLALEGTGAQGVDRPRALLAFGAGGALAAFGMLGFVAATGDLGAYLRIQIADVPAMYRFIWPRSVGDLFCLPRIAGPATLAALGGAGFVALIALGEMPARLLTVALLPGVALAGVVTQAKGFPYHMHPVTAGVALQWLAFASWLTERCRVAARKRSLLRLVPLGAAMILAMHVAEMVQGSPHLQADWLVWDWTPELRETSAYFDHFTLPDFFPYEMRQTAEFLRTHTAEDERVQTYGMDPYVLFLARRLSATPYVYAYDLDVDAALAGGSGARPTEAQADRIRAIQSAHADDLRERLEAHPPGAFVFFDGAPLLTEGSAWDDFVTHCPASARWVAGRYREAARFGHDHVWLRKSESEHE